MEITPLGDSALIVRVRERSGDSTGEAPDGVLRTCRQLRIAATPGIIELAPAYTSVAVFFDPVAVVKASGTPNEAFRWLSLQIHAAVARIADSARVAGRPAKLVEIPVCYDDPEFALDLDRVAEHTKLSVCEVVDLHTAAEYRVACIGFVPGFPFLTGLAKRLATPRRATPRKEIPPGSVGIGGAQTGIYPLRSPGGWNLIGRTPVSLFDPTKNPPALMRAGDHVRFRAITRAQFQVIIGETSSQPQTRPRNFSSTLGMRVTAARAGFLTSVQDLGRAGFREFGVSTSGALDPFALRIANLLVGNDEGAAGLEITLGGLQLRFADDRVIAWCGGEFDVRVGATPLPAGHACLVSAGEQLKFRAPKIGCRAWLAISGEIDVPLVLGSRSTDLRAGFGGCDGRALRDGDQLYLRGVRLSQTAATEEISSWSAPYNWASSAKRDPVLRFVQGIDWERFNASALQRFTSEAFAVSPDSDRMGARFDGPELGRNDDADLISEGVAPGTIQVPPSGKPILLLGDCQTIGGYPKIAHVITVDLGMAAQLRAGDRVRFAEVSLADAHRLVLERELELERFRIGLSLRMS